MTVSVALNRSCFHPTQVPHSAGHFGTMDILVCVGAIIAVAFLRELSWIFSQVLVAALSPDRADQVLRLWVFRKGST